MQLLPDPLHDEDAGDGVTFYHNSGMQLSLEVLERHKYTTFIRLDVYFGFDKPVITNPLLTVRIYHDAKVAEVIGCHHHFNFHPEYPYPNKYMFVKDEKRQLNRLLSELLDYCVLHQDKEPTEPLDWLLT